ncbi:SpoVK/Ycf46/Vps4 family AAA+-type ATPase [Mobilisporobacter senegalensis]|uniref:SpoVK/Ycf46/Vps4 family AAA+-type ATPase n=2 Tax=Mobilisporobacter senegalensis TaxID=1329262 RepID=A0A3N1XTG5_9FIRM|nr:SpoVK/Ycf46/Vps4 family AAA+-type ATPase [Mobilisporobacter senegalensis]
MQVCSIKSYQNLINTTRGENMHSYTNSRLYTIAKNNYILLTKYCGLLSNEGYWDNPESVLQKSIYEMLDIYVQSVLINLSVYCNKTDDEIKNFIISIPNTNAIMYPADEEPTTEILNHAKKIMNAPPIILQLCGLRDSQKNTNLTVVFFDAMLNILLAMSYLNNSKDMYVMKYIQEYYKKISAFLDTKAKNNSKIDDKYIFRKICDDQFNINFELLESSTQSSSKSSIQDHKQEDSHSHIEGKTNHKDNMSLQEMSKEEVKNDIQETEQEDNLDSLLTELNELVGLSNVKEEINSLINLIKVRKLRETYNMPQMDMSFHMVFTGNPGTGKTTVARLIAKIYKELGLLSDGNLVETDRAGLVAGYVGQTALKVKEVVEKAIGGVLFIDEAYSLTNGVGSNDFGSEAIDTLVKMMEDNRDNLVVIVAGYKKEMENFLKSNTGLISRFNKFLEFSDYTTEDLIDILNTMAKRTDLKISEDATLEVKDKLNTMPKSKLKIFGNARGIRNVFEKIIVNQANRLVTIDAPTKDELTQIIKDDVIGAVN